MPQEILIQGRIVRGHPAVKRPVMDENTKQQKRNEKGELRENVYFGLAVEKSIFTQQYWSAFYQEALAAYPNGVPNTFAYKYTDGDVNDSEGKPYNRLEGYAGCFVINFSTEGFPPPVYKEDRNAPGGYRQMTAEEVNCGDYVAVTTLLKYNGQSGGTRKPGLYVNPVAILHIGYGSKIITASIDPKEKFAGFQSQLPQGASATPLMSNAPIPSTMMPLATPYQPVAAPYQPVGVMPPPHNQFVANAVGQPMQPAPAYPSNPGQYPGMMPGR